MPERHAELLEINLGQLRQDIGVDFTRAKERFVLPEAETSQPIPDIHAALRGPERIILRLQRPVQGRAVHESGWVVMTQRDSRSDGQVWGRGCVKTQAFNLRVESPS